MACDRGAKRPLNPDVLGRLLTQIIPITLALAKASRVKNVIMKNKSHIEHSQALELTKYEPLDNSERL